jgi:hypothetical protein
MGWLRFDDAYTDHPKIQVLSAEAFRLWHCSIAWQARQNGGLGLDGRIPKKMMPVLARSSQWQQLLQELTEPVLPGEAPLLEDGGDHWKIHDIHDYNPSAEQLLRLRETTRERVGRHRRRARQESEVGRQPSEAVDGGPDGVSNAVTPSVTNEGGRGAGNAPPPSPDPTSRSRSLDPPSPSPTPPPSRGGGRPKAPPPPADAADVVLWIPVVGKPPTVANSFDAPFRYVQDVNAPELGDHRWNRRGDAYEYGVRRGELDALHVAFPAVNALQKLRGLREWCRGRDPKMRYTYGGMSAFLRKRFDAAQNETARSRPAGPAPTSSPGRGAPPLPPQRSDRSTGSNLEDWNPDQ